MPTTPTATAVGDGLEFRADGCLHLGARLARSEDVAIRADLPVGHPLRGTRALRCVPSGWGDVVIGADSRPVSAVALVAEEPIEEPLADGEFVRTK